MPTNLPPKGDTITEHKLHETDTGSPEVQIALLSDRVTHLTEHLKVHKKDYGSQLGLVKMVGRRSKLLRYLRSKSPERYRTILGRLGLRR